MDADLFARVFVTTLVILDPVGNVPVFLALTRTEAQRRERAALQATLVAAAVILVFALFGESLLELLSISVESLQVSGGLVLVLVALELLRTGGGSETGSLRGGNTVLVPLGTPLLAGPGAIAATMVYMRRAQDTAEVATVAVSLLSVLVVVYAALRFAVVVARVLGDNGIELASRIVGLVLAAIAVQLVAEGVEAWVRHGVT